MSDEEKHLQEYIDELTNKVYENLGIANVTKDWTAFDWQEYEYQKLLRILDPYKKQIDILNTRLLVATTLLKQISNDMEIVGDKLTEAAYNSTNPTCPMSERCDTCLFFIEALAGCYYKHLKEIEDFLKSLEDNSNA